MMLLSSLTFNKSSCWEEKKAFTVIGTCTVWWSVFSCFVLVDAEMFEGHAQEPSSGSLAVIGLRTFWAAEETLTTENVFSPDVGVWLWGFAHLAAREKVRREGIGEKVWWPRLQEAGFVRRCIVMLERPGLLVPVKRKCNAKACRDIR